MNSDEVSPDKTTKQDQLKPYLKYSGLGFQMIVIIIIAAYGGMWLDEHQGNKNPWWTIAFMLVAVISSIYMVIASVTKK